MVSGLVTSPEDQERICFEEARPMLIASKLLMSIKLRQRSKVWRREGWTVDGAQWTGGAWSFCPLSPVHSIYADSCLALGFHVVSLLLFRRFVRLPPVALGLDLVLGLVFRVGGRLA